MKLVSFVSFKGGAGKTTALMAVCSSLAERGYRIGLFEADENAPLSGWRENALEAGTWHGNCRIYPSDDMQSFEAAFEAAEARGTDIVLIDTQGGGSELNNAILVNSNLVVIPTALTSLDIDAATETHDYAVRLFETEGEAVPMAVLLQRQPVGRLTMSQSADLALLQALPQFEARFHHRDAFASIKARGLLHRLYEKLCADPAKRLAARHIRTAMDEADAFAEDVLAALDMSAAVSEPEAVPAHAD